MRVQRQQKDLRRRCGKVERKGRETEDKRAIFSPPNCPISGETSYGNLNCSRVPYSGDGGGRMSRDSDIFTLVIIQLSSF